MATRCPAAGGSVVATPAAREDVAVAVLTVAVMVRVVRVVWVDDDAVAVVAEVTVAVTTVAVDEMVEVVFDMDVTEVAV
jgi:hypothetical protein